MNRTTVALGLVLVVLAIATTASRRVAVTASLVAFAVFNFFFLPPTGTFSIAKRDDAIALVTLLAVSLIGSHLSQQARRKAEEALRLERERQDAEVARRSAETKSTLVASLSHDLKTPLTALTLAASNLGAASLTPAQRREQLEIVESELARLRRLFDHVVEMASVEAQTASAELEWVHPADLIEAARVRAAVALTQHRVDLLSGGDHLVRVDPRLTSSALAHLLENAAAYAPPSPIEIRIGVRDETLTIAVRDHGPGVPPGDLDRIFERFHRGTAKGFGSGMGLAIARGLIALQGGRISAANDPDGGAVFTIEIPVATQPLPVESVTRILE